MFIVPPEIGGWAGKVLIATVLAVPMYEKAQSVTDPVRAHIPLEAHLLSSFPDPNEPVLMNMIYTLTPLVDLKTNVYRWAYWTTSGYRRKPVCEEITKAKIIEQGGN